MVLLRFLKDCMWSIDNKVNYFTENEEKEITDDLAKKMVEAQYAVYADTNIYAKEDKEISDDPETPEQEESYEEIDDKSLKSDKLENKIPKRGRPRKDPEE